MPLPAVRPAHTLHLESGMSTDAFTEPDFKMLFEQAPGMFMVLDPELRIVAATNAYLQATLTHREEIIGKYVFDVFPSNPENSTEDVQRNSLASFKRVLRTGETDAMVLQRHDVRRPAAEGGGFAVRYWSPINSPIFNPDGSVAYIFHRVENVTDYMLQQQQGAEQSKETDALREHAEQMAADLYARTREAAETSRKLKEANEELARLYDKAKELDELKSRFFANVSHELRTPLALILGPVESLLRREDVGDDVRHDLLVVQRSARLLQRHVNDLLDIAKLEAGRMTLHYARTDLARLTRIIASYFESTAAEQQIAYTVNTPASLPAEVDGEKVERMLINLLSNALKFTPTGGAITVTLEERDGRAAIHVQDTGPGVPENQREAIFERFRQGDGGTERRYGGTGLGLAIVREFAGIHGGAVGVTDAPGGGARFTLELPLAAPAGAPVAQEAPAFTEETAREARDELHQPSATEAVEHPRTAAAGVRILVVEDNPDMNAFLADALGRQYQVTRAFTGQEGVEKALADPPDLILADVMMPVMSGDRMVEELRRHPEMEDVPIVMLTAKADDALRVRLLRQGVQDYLYKPFSTAEVLARVDGLLAERRRTIRRLRELNATLEQRVRERTAALQATNRELEAFSYSVSHDLRAPARRVRDLTNIVIRLFAERLDEEGREYLALISGSSERMLQLIEDLLRLSRIGRAEMRMGPVDVSVLAGQVAEELRQREPARAVDFTIAPNLRAWGDGHLLKIVLENLLGNAWKFTRGQEVARIAVGQMAQDHETVYFIRDNGAGFDMTYAEKLFTPFQRLHSDSEFPGTGIGLSIVQRIIHRHGGRVWAEGAVDAGATFFFTLPSSPDGAAQREASHE